MKPPMLPWMWLPLIAIVSALHFLVWWKLGEPVVVEAGWQGKVASMSFAPFRRGQSPLTRVYPSPEDIAEDVARVAGSANAIRTYTSREGLQVVPELARKHGLTVTHSAWLGREPPRNPSDAGINPAEVAALIEAANAYPDVIKRVIVGNEVLLRQDLPVDKLIDYIRQVRASVRQPVSYADVWAFYLKFPQVADEVDFLTIHILPYWEDEPQSVKEAERHLVDIVKLMKQRFPGKPILIGEAGWPTNGRTRGPAVPSIPNAAEYVRTLAAVSAREGFDYNVVEAFDQPWKSRMEGTVGANWGVLNIDREAKFGLSGPVGPMPDWGHRALGGLLLGSLAGFVFIRRSKGALAAVGVAALAQVLGGCISQTGFEAWARSYFTWQDFWAATKLAAVAVYAWIILRASVNLAPSGLTRVVPFLFALAAVIWSALLTFDGRYRDIPINDFLVPVVGVALLQLATGRHALGQLFGSFPLRQAWPKYLAILLVMGAALVLVGEGFAIVGDDFVVDHPGTWDRARLIARACVSNVDMLVWAAMLLIMAWPFWSEAVRERRA